jgi:predicted DNA-binding antitoxin AbrB/MazE fold protein
MQTITATFEDGVLKPAQPLDLPAQTQVRITIEVLPASPLTVGQLDAFLRSLPALGKDAGQTHFSLPIIGYPLSTSSKKALSRAAS